MKEEQAVRFLKEATRSIPDYPNPGIIFRDLTTIFQSGEAFALAIDMLENCLLDKKGTKKSFDKFAGIEARGFVLTGALAAKMGGGLALLRKPGKLPYKKRRIEYKLEYGEDALVKVLFLVELPELEGRRKLSAYDVDSIITFEGH